MQAKARINASRHSYRETLKSRQAATSLNDRLLATLDESVTVGPQGRRVVQRLGKHISNGFI